MFSFDQVERRLKLAECKHESIYLARPWGKDEGGWRCNKGIGCGPIVPLPHAFVVPTNDWDELDECETCGEDEYNEIHNKAFRERMLQ